jgi:hypothetical protein
MRLMKRLDGKFSIDGERIVKTSNGEPIPNDEPVFLIRARDRLALPLLRIYEQLSNVDGCNDYHFSALYKTIEEFARFAAHNPGRMKQPSVTRGL